MVYHNQSVNQTDGNSALDDVNTPVVMETITADNKGSVTTFPDDSSASKVDSDAVPASNAQHGIKDIEAVTLTWTKKSLAAVAIRYAQLHSLCLCVYP